MPLQVCGGNAGALRRVVTDYHGDMQMGMQQSCKLELSPRSQGMVLVILPAFRSVHVGYEWSLMFIVVYRAIYIADGLMLHFGNFANLGLWGFDVTD